MHREFAISDSVRSGEGEPAVLSVAILCSLLKGQPQCDWQSVLVCLDGFLLLLYRSHQLPQVSTYINTRTYAMVQAMLTMCL